MPSRWQPALVEVRGLHHCAVPGHAAGATTAASSLHCTFLKFAALAHEHRRHAVGLSALSFQVEQRVAE